MKIQLSQAHPLIICRYLRQTTPVFAIYVDRWPVEQLPLAAKQMLGQHRQFVFASESVQRLPELALLAGNILTYLVTVLPPIPARWWDRHQKNAWTPPSHSGSGQFFRFSPGKGATSQKERPHLPSAKGHRGASAHKMSDLARILPL